MPDAPRSLPHLLVLGRATNRDLHRKGGSRPRLTPRGQRTAGSDLVADVLSAFTGTDADREALSPLSDDELHALGTFVTVEGTGALYPLKLPSLERWTPQRKSPARPEWQLMSVHPATDVEPERAVVWVADASRAKFLKLFEDYAAQQTKSGKPRNQDLAANIASIRRTVLLDLWQSEGEPEQRGTVWWELWLAGRAVDQSQATEMGRLALDQLRRLGYTVADRTTVLQNRVIVWVKASWDSLQVLPFSAVPLAEIRRPSFVDTIEDLTKTEQAEWVGELAARVTPADQVAPAVCHLDTGVARTHLLLASSLAEGDLHTVVGASGFDVDGHGTRMAGIALYGNLDAALLASGQIELRHRLESVRILPSVSRSERAHNPLDYGTVTAEAISTAEIASPRRRVVCMPVSTEPDKPGDPTLWSATVDALSVGTDVVRDGNQLHLIGTPNPAAARLLVISAGNTELPLQADSFDAFALSDATGIADPAQAWNALTVGAYTELDLPPSDPAFEGWRAIAAAGELSPHSRTSVPFSRKWPLKPDICMEGGNVLTDGRNLHESHPVVSLRTTGVGNDLSVTSANATSAATAAASRLAALAMASYPGYWPETIRGLIVHAADWTPAMDSRIRQPKLKLGARAALLRHYGWGVPTEDAVLRSSRQAVTMVVQDEFVPFHGPDFRMRHFRLHDLPWPRQVLEAMGPQDVTMKITLSYFVEPNPSRRGWRHRYAYASHGLRFELKAPLETETDFIARVGRAAADEESREQSGSGGLNGEIPKPSSANNRWLVGPQQRNTGSLHQDLWTGSGAALAQCDRVAVYPVGGWWKNNGRKDRVEMPVRSALLISLTTAEQGIDLYTPIANELRIPTPVSILAAR